MECDAIAWCPGDILSAVGCHRSCCQVSGPRNRSVSALGEKSGVALPLLGSSHIWCCRRGNEYFALLFVRKRLSKRICIYAKTFPCRANRKRTAPLHSLALLLTSSPNLPTFNVLWNLQLIIPIKHFMLSDMAGFQKFVISLLLILTACFLFLAQSSEAAKGPKITDKVRCSCRSTDEYD